MACIYIEAWHEAAESRFEAHEAQLDLLPDLVAQLKPETLTPAHRAIVKRWLAACTTCQGFRMAPCIRV